MTAAMARMRHKTEMDSSKNLNYGIAGSLGKARLPESLIMLKD